MLCRKKIELTERPFAEIFHGYRDCENRQMLGNLLLPQQLPEIGVEKKSLLMRRMSKFN